MKRKLLLMVALLLAAAALTFSTGPIAQQTVYAGNDCDLARQLCNDTSAGIYNLCVSLGGDASQCATQEAENRISCMAGAGCPLHD